MQNCNNNYKFLIDVACGTLGLPYQQLKDTYKNYPICLMEYIEGTNYERFIEIRFYEQKATISLSFTQENICNGTFMFFDTVTEENAFIEFLNLNTEYDFKRSYWRIANCYVKVTPSNCETAFYFHTP